MPPELPGPAESPAVPDPPLPPVAVNLAPPQAYAVNEQSASITLTRNQWLRRLGFTMVSSDKRRA